MCARRETYSTGTHVEACMHAVLRVRQYRTQAMLGRGCSAAYPDVDRTEQAG